MSAREVELTGGAPWGFRMHGGVDQHQPLRISRISRMLVKVVLLLLPAVVYGRINIRVKAGKNEELANVEYIGTSVEIIPDKEREVWQITDSKLKDAAEAFSGGRPSDVFVKSPTPWEDLYKRFGWSQVQRTLYPQFAKVLGITSKPIIVTTQDFVNNSTVKATYNTGITQTVTETVSNKWSKESELEIGQEINYKIEFGAGEVGGTSSISYKSTWGEETEKTKAVTVGSTSGVSVELQPGQSVIATLTATQGTMEVQVFYQASLSGSVACNYAEKFDGHNFYAYDINELLEAANLPTLIESSETIKIGFYSDAKVTVSDKASLALIAEEKAPIRIK